MRCHNWRMIGGAITVLLLLAAIVVLLDWIIGNRSHLKRPVYQHGGCPVRHRSVAALRRCQGR